MYCSPGPKTPEIIFAQKLYSGEPRAPGFKRRIAGTFANMLLPRKLLIIAYVVIGVVAASSRNYLENLDTVRRFVSAVLAIALWPLLLLGIDLHIR